MKKVDDITTKCDDNVPNYVSSLLEKSEEAYLMALEIINKPTIKYRTEGFCFFICNAWELALKAYIIQNENNLDAINFKDRSNRTIGLDSCVEKVFTSTTDKTKANLSKIRDLRNKATHSILPEYDFIFSSVFQRCITNYNKFFEKRFSQYKLNRQVTAFISLSNVEQSQKSFLNLNPKSLLQLARLTDDIKADDSIKQTIILSSVKKTADADVLYKIDGKATKSIQFVEVPKDINTMYPYTTKDIIKGIKETVELSLGINHGFSERSFHAICKDKAIKENQAYCYTVNYSGGVRKYTEETIEYIAYLYISSEAFRDKYKSKSLKNKMTSEKN